jgi:hypothetical protein
LANKLIADIIKSPPQFIYCTAEEVILWLRHLSKPYSFFRVFSRVACASQTAHPERTPQFGFVEKDVV